MTRRDAFTASGVVFVASACTLVLEIAAARLLAPYLGVSLYTWTSIIGVLRRQGPDGDGVVGVMRADALEDWLRGANPVVLTDDYAPADNLMAPIFLERDL